MHLSSLDNMRSFRNRYLTGKEDRPLRILDLGSTAIGGSYRPIFEKKPWDYIGVDLASGENVDLVLSDPYNWLEIDSSSIDVLISGQTFEHIAYFWKTMTEIARVLRPGGLCCIIAPSGGPEHRYPVDCWRFYPDGFRALAEYAGLETLDVETHWESGSYSDDSHRWADTVLVARKPEKSEPAEEEAEHLYRREIDVEAEDSLSKIVRHVGPEKKVLELGPATGYLTKYLKEKLGCVVHCIEVSEKMASEAERFCERMVVADINAVQLEEQFAGHQYDTIIIADVIEHLRENEKTLRSCRKLLKADGRCILSFPNIAHASIIGGLLKGRFDYTPEGLLDRTHVRFYTRASMTALLEKCGFSIVETERLTRLPEDTEIGDSLGDLPFPLQRLILGMDEALTYQFIFVCRQGAASGDGDREPGGDAPSAIDLRRLHLQGLNGRIAELEEALSETQDLAVERLNSLHEHERRIQEYDEALSYAQRLAYERQDEIERLKNQLGYKIYKKIRGLLEK